MAHVAIISKETNLSKIVFKNMSNDQAKTIADHMNTLSRLAAERTGEAIKMVFKAIRS